MSLEDKFEDIYRRKAQDLCWMRVQLSEFIVDDISKEALEWNLENLTNYVAAHLDRHFDVDDMIKLGIDVGLQLVENYIDFCEGKMKKMKRIVYKTQEGEFAKIMGDNPDFDKSKPDDIANPRYIPMDGFKVAPFTSDQQLAFYNNFFRGWEKRI